MKLLYQTRASAQGGRTGHSKLDDGSLALDMAMPGSGTTGVNPEQLFALGYAACFDSALALTAQRLKQNITGSKTSVQVGMGQNDAGGYALDIELSVEVGGLPADAAHALVTATHQVCPYSNAVRGNVAVRLNVLVV
ncbi:organic hydroperoxide resistance protein [Craterilacuibacter sp.]|uniref:organic hydroperoxide resistance protein n=1 Tax=Craterilacuibacter sp. TaxID=2870909 RepID=UPI003F3608B4